MNIDADNKDSENWDSKRSSYISTFDMLKIGVGPSSSHTMGPWLAMRRFVGELREQDLLLQVERVDVHAYGSLAKTGYGHGTDIAILLGLEDWDYRSIPVERIQQRSKEIEAVGQLWLGGLPKKSGPEKVEGGRAIAFYSKENLHFHFQEALPYHPNGLRCLVRLSDNREFAKEYYSIGGGFVVCAEELSETEQSDEQSAALPHLPHPSTSQVPYPFDTALELNRWCREEEIGIAEVVRQNELALLTTEKAANTDKTALEERMMAIWRVMYEAVYMGIRTSGELPVLGVKRRAPQIFADLVGIDPESLADDKLWNLEQWLERLYRLRWVIGSLDLALQFISCFAIAVNEQNACFGRVVTSPTNGSAGVIPATLLYYHITHPETGPEKISDFLLTAGAIGGLFKAHSTISAAMGGCQAEIGVSSAMAAAAYCAALGGSPAQACSAAEIAMEHHLGLTCDPVGGLVQIPCIERNAMGAIKAITAAYLALMSQPETLKVSLDTVIATMWETAQGMDLRYKETSEGGLALRVPFNSPVLPNC